ncbi:MAG: 30S ribosomal protein S6 [Candidatus Omnitrophica bacterium]|nr:30S ribosomal protein S6 [Candidatus Omnitrophota bacterium]
MNKYEAMIIVRPDFTEEERKNLFHQIAEAIAKNGGAVTQAVVWAERRKLAFPIKRAKKFDEGLFYLVNFDAPSDAITKVRYLYRVNEGIVRTLILRLED